MTFEWLYCCHHKINGGNNTEFRELAVQTLNAGRDALRAHGKADDKCKSERDNFVKMLWWLVDQHGKWATSDSAVIPDIVTLIRTVEVPQYRQISITREKMALEAGATYLCTSLMKEAGML